MCNTHAVPSQPTPEWIYEIRLEGQLSPQWQAWFDNATCTPNTDGTTSLVCSVIDQAALHGLLRKVRDLGMPLISVHRWSNPLSD